MWRSTATWSPDRLCFGVLAGGRSMLGGFRGPIGSLSSIQDSFPGLGRDGNQRLTYCPKVCILPDEVGDKIIVTPHAEREKYVAWVAVLRQHKRPDVLIEIARKAPGIRFVVCGGPGSSPPGYSERIVHELRATPNIEYLGHVAPEKAEQVIAGAAVFLSTSDQEGFPNTFTQAWSAGTPIVSLRLDPDHLIERVGMGTVSESVARVIADINALIDSPQRRDDIAIRARKFVGENYSASAVVSLFERALDGAH